MPAPKGNRFWEARSKHGRDKIFDSPEMLRAACYEYFDSVLDNPLREQKLSRNGKKATVNKTRPFTMKGLFVFLDIGRGTWELYSKREEFIPVIERIENIVFVNKFEGAAAGFFNANLISRELGLVDQKGFRFEDQTDETIDAIIKKLMSHDEE